MSIRRRAQLRRSKRNASRARSTWSSSATSAGVVAIASMRAAHDDVGELGVQRGELVAGRELEQAQHELAVDEAHRVVVRVEAEQLVDRVVDVVGDVHQAEVVGRHVAAVEQLGARRTSIHSCQYVPPGTSRSTIGPGCALPVCSSVSSSNASSSVPKPPGSSTNPSDSLMNASFRVKK